MDEEIGTVVDVEHDRVERFPRLLGDDRPDVADGQLGARVRQKVSAGDRAIAHPRRYLGVQLGDNHPAHVCRAEQLPQGETESEPADEDLAGALVEHGPGQGAFGRCLLIVHHEDPVDPQFEGTVVTATNERTSHGVEDSYHGQVVSSTVPDPLSLLGAWTLARTIDDRKGPETSTVQGTTELARQGDGRVRWSESGTLQRGGHEIPVNRTLYVELRDAGWFVTFDDGRDFHPWEPGEEVVHPCAADTYVGRIELVDADTWTVEWNVTGPAKDYTMISRLTRHAG